MAPRPGRLIGEIAATVPGAIDAFRRAGIDCCRDAGLTLEEASLRTGARSATLILRAPRVEGPTPALPDWYESPLPILIRHITETLHPPAIATMERLSLRVTEMAQTFPNEWAIGEIRSAFAEVANNLVIHVWRVENEVFPLLGRLAEAPRGTEPALTADDLPNPHDPMLEGLRRLRTLTQDYSVPSHPPEMSVLLGELHGFDEVLHRHIHLEHHVLYPRAFALCGPPRPGTSLATARSRV